MLSATQNFPAMPPQPPPFKYRCYFYRYAVAFRIFGCRVTLYWCWISVAQLSVMIALSVSNGPRISSGWITLYMIAIFDAYYYCLHITTSPPAYCISRRLRALTFILPRQRQSPRGAMPPRYHFSAKASIMSVIDYFWWYFKNYPFTAPVTTHSASATSTACPADGFHCPLPMIVNTTKYLRLNRATAARGNAINGIKLQFHDMPRWLWIFLARVAARYQSDFISRLTAWYRRYALRMRVRIGLCISPWFAVLPHIFGDYLFVMPPYRALNVTRYNITPSFRRPGRGRKARRLNVPPVSLYALEGPGYFYGRL